MAVNRLLLLPALLLSIFAVSARSESGPAAAQDSRKLNRLKRVLKDVHFVAYTPLSYNPAPSQKHAATADGIRADLQVLKSNGLGGIVTYSCNPSDGMDQIVPIATDMNMTVIEGIYDIKSVREIATGVDLATRYSNTVVAVLVGNETLLRGGSFEDLEAAMMLVRMALPDVPISTSEPITSYGNADLRRLCDFHAPNIHWIFQGRDLANYREAVDWLIDRCRALRSVRYGDRPILVKEHGYPSSGNPAFTPELQRDYWRYLISKLSSMQTNDMTVTAFEAFSLPWKSPAGRSNGDKFAASERYWGCWDENRQPKPVVEVLKNWK